MCALVTGVQTCALPIFEAMTMADKIVVMHDGKVEQIGEPLELYDHPANLFVAGFIGSPAMNFIEGRVSLNGRARFISEAGVELPLNGAPGARDGQTAIYGVRPEHLMLSDDGVEAEVIVVEPTGSETQGFTRIGHREVVAEFRARPDFRPGDKKSTRLNSSH